MFENVLRSHVNERVQIVTLYTTITGVLRSVTSTTATVAVEPYPGYGPIEDVTVRLDAIAYVRIYQ